MFGPSPHRQSCGRDPPGNRSSLYLGIVYVYYIKRNALTLSSFPPPFSSFSVLFPIIPFTLLLHFSFLKLPLVHFSVYLRLVRHDHDWIQSTSFNVRNTIHQSKMRVAPHAQHAWGMTIVRVSYHVKDIEERLTWWRMVGSTTVHILDNTICNVYCPPNMSTRHVFNIHWPSIMIAFRTGHYVLCNQYVNAREM